MQEESAGLHRDLEYLHVCTPMLSKDGKVILIGNKELSQRFSLQRARAVWPKILAWYDSYLQAHPGDWDLRAHVVAAAIYAPHVAK